MKSGLNMIYLSKYQISNCFASFKEIERQSLMKSLRLSLLLYTRVPPTYIKQISGTAGALWICSLSWHFHRKSN